MTEHDHNFGMNPQSGPRTPLFIERILGYCRCGRSEVCFLGDAQGTIWGRLLNHEGKVNTLHFVCAQSCSIIFVLTVFKLTSSWIFTMWILLRDHPPVRGVLEQRTWCTPRAFGLFQGNWFGFWGLILWWVEADVVCLCLFLLVPDSDLDKYKVPEFCLQYETSKRSW